MNENEIAVLITTTQRGVFFGYTTSTDTPIVRLRAARLCVRWPKANKGFLGLAADGPLKGARVGPSVDIELRERDITCVARCTERAIAAWEAAPWAI